jgi:cyclic pyranopterin phosphate synthase
MPAEGVDFIEQEKILSYEDIVEIAKTAVELGISKIRLTGGEPLVRKGLVGLISKLNKIPGIEDLSLTTNGILLVEQGAELKEAGLDRVNISLDTFQEDKFAEITGCDKLVDVLAGIETALDLGLRPVKINMVVMKGVNEQEIFDFIKLTRYYPLHVRFIEFMPTDTKKIDQENHYLSIDNLKQKIKSREDLLATQFKVGNGPAYYYQVRDSLGSIGFISPISNHFCASCNRLRLTSTGKLRPCLSTSKEVDLQQILSEDKEKLEEGFKDAIRQKPKQHSLIQESLGQNMSQIGG